MLIIISRCFAFTSSKLGILSMELPRWTDIVKTGTFKELAPYDPDCFYGKEDIPEAGSWCWFIPEDLWRNGRRITSSGQRDLDRVAGQIVVAS
ncbi:hypothetical protein RHMOL_Rhmol10G0060600 [Rhododendron molle]|uniref:Uncharacterized protein n=1 Tax=Rhododendron molle TaxID=49168 RepID=A0ACC0LZY9_RHOML|nr:hypothetical protein RHMOL_Rhmol10G0060600 [Rhododendron molle]